MERRVQRWWARRRTERFFAAVAHLVAQEDPAAEHYYWKIASQRQLRFQQTRERLVDVVGVDVADSLLRRAARRARAPKRAFVLAGLLLCVVPGPFATNRPATVLFLLPLCSAAGSTFARRNLRKVSHLLGGAGEYPLEDFPYNDVRSAVLRHRHYVPAGALSVHPQQRTLAGHLGERDPETLEIAEKLAGEFAGSAVELLEAARRLR